MSFCVYFFDAEFQIPETWLQAFSPLFFLPRLQTPQQNSPQAINSHSYKIHYEYSNLLSQVSFHGIEAFGL